MSYVFRLKLPFKVHSKLPLPFLTVTVLYFHRLLYLFVDWPKG